MAIVEERSSRGMRSKLDNRGKACLYLGRTLDHAADVHRFWNFATSRVIVSCNHMAAQDVRIIHGS